MNKKLLLLLVIAIALSPLISALTWQSQTGTSINKIFYCYNASNGVKVGTTATVNCTNSGTFATTLATQAATNRATGEFNITLLTTTFTAGVYQCQIDCGDAGAIDYTADYFIDSDRVNVTNIETNGISANSIQTNALQYTKFGTDAIRASTFDESMLNNTLVVAGQDALCKEVSLATVSTTVNTTLTNQNTLYLSSQENNVTARRIEAGAKSNFTQLLTNTTIINAAVATANTGIARMENGEKSNFTLLLQNTSIINSNVLSLPAPTLQQITQSIALNLTADQPGNWSAISSSSVSVDINYTKMWTESIKTMCTYNSTTYTWSSGQMLCDMWKLR